MRAFPSIRDLVVDVSSNYAAKRKIKPFTPRPPDAADGTWRRILTEPVSGAILDYGRTTYRPPTALTDYVRARDRVCRFPTCQTPASRCDLDHLKPYEPDGITADTNLWALCRRHHRLKDQHTGWTVTGDPAHLMIWTSPMGRRYESHPYHYQDDDPIPNEPPEPLPGLAGESEQAITVIPMAARTDIPFWDFMKASTDQALEASLRQDVVSYNGVKAKSPAPEGTIFSLAYVIVR